MNYEKLPSTAQQFAQKVQEFRQDFVLHAQKILSPELLDKIDSCREQIRAELGIPSTQPAIIYGEQAYGVNEPPKVLGKRILAKAVNQQDPRIARLELIASHDILGSEGGLYRLQIPNTQSPPDGIQSINVLQGWKSHKNRPTHYVPSPVPDTLKEMSKKLEAQYGQARTDNFMSQLLATAYEMYPESYATANIHILQQIESKTNLLPNVHVTESQLDSKLGQKGGIEVMLALWEKIIAAGQNHPIKEVRTLTYEETPYQLYHDSDPNCHGRMISKFVGPNVGPETPVISTCLECNAVETTTSQSVIESKREMTWKAIPRVLAYAWLGVADGHITGGGSYYNQVVQGIALDMDLPYFPITYMDPKKPVLNYKSIPLFKKGASKGAFFTQAQEFFNAGKAATADLILSVGTLGINQALSQMPTNDFSVNQQIDCTPFQDIHNLPISN